MEDQARQLEVNVNIKRSLIPWHRTTSLQNFQVSIDLLKISDLDEVDSSISVKFKLILSWFENRLMYHNLKETSDENIIEDKTAEKMWIPPLKFANYEDK